jgi:hypothetical protein
LRSYTGHPARDEPIALQGSGVCERICPARSSRCCGSEAMSGRTGPAAPRNLAHHGDGCGRVALSGIHEMGVCLRPPGGTEHLVDQAGEVCAAVIRSAGGVYEESASNPHISGWIWHETGTSRMGQRCKELRDRLPRADPRAANLYVRRGRIPEGARARQPRSVSWHSR